jgi:predicted enzyme related to lactoylglutathione lyase
MAHGDFAHIEFPADDLARAKRFYEGVFGWQLQEATGFENYLVYRTAGGLGGGFGLRGQTAGPRLRDYISVDSIDESIPKVESLGGKVTLGRTEVPGQGFYAVTEDSEGTEIALWEGRGQGG